MADPMLFVLLDKNKFAENKSEFAAFLENEQYGYGEKVRTMLDQNEKRLIVNMDHLRDFKRDLAKSFLSKPFEYMPALEEALKDFVRNIGPGDSDHQKESEETDVNYQVGIEGSFGSLHVSPRGLNARTLGSLVLVEGIITKASLVRPKVVRSVHYCPATGEQMSRTYRDATSSLGIPSSTVYPTKDEKGNPLQTEYGLSQYKDHQTLTIQEMPERAPAGQLPCSVEVIIEDDLVDQVKPGDRVQVCGIYKGLPFTNSGHTSAIFRTIIIGNNVRQMAREVAGPVMTDKDLENIKKASQSKDIFELLSQSLAPSIHGHEFIKKALLLMLLGGTEKNLANKTHLRGDINILLIGDPSTAKSQLLRFVLNTAPLAINTTGKGSSGVGLTAAVTSDSETGERRLEAGAMVLADRGVVCIDEFDKMGVDDRVAIHEVMEQQTVTIAKAGIHTTLNARCSVLAAANPIYGQYNRQKKPTENIALPDSLLSRFDLLFIVLDDINPEHDRRIADHVLRMHQYRNPYETDRIGMESFDDDLLLGNDKDYGEEGQITPVYQKFDKLLHDLRKNKDIFSIPFIKKYLLYAKTRIHPILTNEASSFINNAYATLRSRDDMKTLPVTARTLETMIRLATAHAKCKLNREVSEEDAKMAVSIMNFALYHDTNTSEMRSMSNNNNNVNYIPETSYSSSEIDINNNGESSKKRKNNDGSSMEIVEEETQNQEEEEESLVPRNKKQKTVEVVVDPAKKQSFQKALSDYFQKKRVESVTLIQLLQFINSSNKSVQYSNEEADTYLQEMHNAEQIFYDEGVIRQM